MTSPIGTLASMLSKLRKPKEERCPRCGSVEKKIVSRGKDGAVLYQCKFCGFLWWSELKRK